ncbi:MAG: hypothetical protein N3A38_06355 [Planctomycetota bacterium]|nr:hypothetical protein [Planctomycetota bacterium]
MRAFRDNAGREWTVAVDIAAVKRVRDLMKLDLVGKDAASAFERLISDPVTLCDVLYAICKPQADGAGVTDEDFGRAMAGDAIERAARALLEELADFTPNVRDRERARRIVTALFTLAERTRDVLDAKTDEALRMAESVIHGAKSGGSQESSESIPGRCRCES